MTETLPGLGQDVIVVKRPSAGADAEGNPTEAVITPLAMSGTWGSPTYQDISRASQLGQSIEAIVAMPTADVRMGDRVTARGKEYTVVTVAETRFHIRVGLRRAE